MIVSNPQKPRMDGGIPGSNLDPSSKRQHPYGGYGMQLYEHEGPEGAQHITGSFSFASKLGLKLPNLAPDVEMAPMPTLPVVTAAPMEMVTEQPGPNEPKKKKYAKEAWPGKKPAHALFPMWNGLCSKTGCVYVLCHSIPCVKVGLVYRSVHIYMYEQSLSCVKTSSLPIYYSDILIVDTHTDVLIAKIDIVSGSFKVRTHSWFIGLSRTDRFILTPWRKPRVNDEELCIMTWTEKNNTNTIYDAAHDRLELFFGGGGLHLYTLTWNNIITKGGIRVL